MRAVFLLVALVGCSSAPTPATGPDVTLSLSDATVREAVTAFASASGEPLLVTPDAERYADCVRLSLLVPAPRPVSEVASLLGTALTPEGFSLTRAPTGWTLTHAGETPSACAEVRSAAAPPPAIAPPPPPGPLTETHVDFPRAEAEAMLADEDAMMSAARVIPHEEDGRVVGVRIYGIRRTSLLGRMGIENGDTIYSVNGQSLATPEGLAAAHASARAASEYRVDLARGGARILHVIRLVD